MIASGFHNIPADQYHVDPCEQPSLSNSIAQILLKESPRKAWFSHPRLNPGYRETRDDKFDIGTAAHAQLLENDQTGIVVVEAKDWRTNAAKEQREQARTAGKIALLKHNFDATQAMVEAARKFLEKCEITEEWQEGVSELTAIWKEHGVWLRCRFDRIALERPCVIDYKSTTDASPEAFSRLLVRMGYHIQDAFYRRAVRRLAGRDPAFVFLAQSTEPPHECSLHGCDAALREIADAEVERVIALWRECIGRNEWPSYSGRIHWTLPTTWQMKDHEQRLLEAA